MGQVANAAREKQPADGYQLRRACPEVQKLYFRASEISWAGHLTATMPTRSSTIAKR
jgi:hypothetical protein